MRNNSVKLFWIWTSSSEGDVVYRHFLYRALAALLFTWAESFVQFGRRHHEEKLCEIILNLGQWFRRRRLKDFLSGALALLLFSGAKPFKQFWKRASLKTFKWSYMKFGPVVQEEMSFEDITYIELWQPFCSAKRYYLCNLGRRYYEEKFCEIIFEFGSVVQKEMSFKRFDIWSSGGPPVQWS